MAVQVDADDRLAPGLLAQLARVPPRPPAELDRVLDATERCLTRYGLQRTSMSDIARELGVARTTLYRQVSSLEEATALVASRQLYAFVDELATLQREAPGPEAFVEAAVRTVRFVRSSPLALRILEDEPDLVGATLTSPMLAQHIEQVVDLVTPVFAAAMAAGSIRSGDARLVAGVAVRVVGALVLAPAADDLEPLARCALEPLLEPDQSHRRGRRP